MTYRSTPVMNACIVGGGVIGGGWAARFLLHGWQVAVFDPKPAADRRIRQMLENARISALALADVPMPIEGKLRFADSIDEAVSAASWIQESVPEDLASKREVLAEIEKYALQSSIIASSTSGFRPGELQDGARYPERILVAHPFNPVYLLPLVEVVAGSAVSSEMRQRACDILTSIGMKPLVVRKEIDAHIADRLMESMWREALWLVNDDIATTEEIDDAVRYGFGLRWAQMGIFETFRLAGGDAGMAHFIGQFGPALQWPWSKLTDVPEMTDKLVQKIADQSDAQSGRFTVRELERIRDRNLVGLLRSLKERDWGAGALLNEHDHRLAVQQPDLPATVAAEPIRLLELSVLPSWIDYNGHMTEYRFTQVFSDTSDRLLLMIGMDANYVASGCSYYTAETHVMQADEVGVNTPIYSTSQVMHFDAKRLHVFHRVHAAQDDRLLASAEVMYLHVNRESGRVCEASAEIVANATVIANAHAQLRRPETAGRYVGQRKQE